MAQHRYAVVDLIRGLAIVNMVLYHAIWDLVYMYGFEWQWFTGTMGNIWQQAICWTFIFISGFSLLFSSRPVYRGVVVSLAGLAVMAATAAVMPQAMIIYGVLTCLGACMILFGLLLPLLERLAHHAFLWMVVSLVLFVCTKELSAGILGIGAFCVRLPESWYANWFTTFLGLPMDGFYSADYFPFLPWAFLFATGIFCHYYLDAKQWMMLLAPSIAPPLEWVGRYSLWIYLAHQPIITVLLAMAL